MPRPGFCGRISVFERYMNHVIIVPDPFTKTQLTPDVKKSTVPCNPKLKWGTNFFQFYFLFNKGPFRGWIPGVGEIMNNASQCDLSVFGHFDSPLGVPVVCATVGTKVRDPREKSESEVYPCMSNAMCVYFPHVEGADRFM